VAPVSAESRAPLAAPIAGLSHVQLVVADLRASADWYSAVLGLEEQVAGDGYVALRHRRARIVIVLSAAADPASLRSTGARGSLDHLAFAVPDGEALSAWADHLRRTGVRHGGIVPENGNPSLQLQDPDGNTIELVAPGGPGPGPAGPGPAGPGPAGRGWIE
jgi:glyoxylase I family protein